jgi:uncharacterized protein (TIGR02231 family)
MASSVLYASTTREVNSTVQEVTVFLNGAQVMRSAKIEFPAGNTAFRFTNLPEGIDPQSVQVKGQGSFTILSVVHQINYLAGQKKPREIILLEDSLRIFEEKLAFNNSMLQVYKTEEDLLMANKSIGSEEKGIVVSELKMAADFFRTRMADIKKEQLNIARENKYLNEKIEKLRKQLNNINSNLNKPTSEVLISVEAAKEGIGKIQLTYIVSQAGWIPVYDIRAIDVNSPVTLIYNAKVFQHTGENWENVRLKLSTADPRQRGDKPNLTSWYIDFNQSSGGFGYMQNVPQLTRAKKAEAGILEDKLIAETPEESATTADYTEILQHQTNLEFSIKVPYDVPSDNKQYTINIQEYKLPATYQYYCAPKLDRDAFLIARVTGWENYNLLPGEMNLFFEDTYIGKSYLNLRQTTDTLDLSLGRDKNIIITRAKLTDYTADKMLVNTRQKTRGWEISIRNNKKQQVKLVLEDQFPVSMNKDIQVEPVEYSGGSYNKETGKIKWQLIMNPSEDKKIRIAFTVKYPKDKDVIID